MLLAPRPRCKNTELDHGLCEKQAYRLVIREGKTQGSSTLSFHPMQASFHAGPCPHISILIFLLKTHHLHTNFATYLNFFWWENCTYEALCRVYPTIAHRINISCTPMAPTAIWWWKYRWSYVSDLKQCTCFHVPDLKQMYLCLLTFAVEHLLCIYEVGEPWPVLETEGMRVV